MTSSCHTSRKAEYNAPLQLNLNTATVVGYPQYKSFESKYFALTHVELDVRPDWQRQQLAGKAILTLTPYAYPQDSLVLDAQDLTIESLKLNDRESLKYTDNKRQLHISLGKSYKPSDTFRIYIGYIANPNKIIPDSIAEKSDEKGLFFINAGGKDTSRPTELWTQGETRHNSAWFPCIDATNQKFTQKIAITVDDKYTTLSNGLLIKSAKNNDGSRTDVWVQNLPSATYLSMIAAGNWKISRDKWRNMAVDYYLEPEYAPFAKLIFGNTPKMIEYFSRLLKYDYPWQKFSQVVCRDFVSGAMENTSAVVHYELLQHDARAHIDNTYENVISHELFHHWFGDLVTCKGWANLALNESMATLGEYLWEEHANDIETAQLHRQQDLVAYLAEAATSMKPVIQHYYVDAEDLFDRTRYEKGGLIFSMLRNYLGDSTFFKGLHNYLVAHAFQNVELADMRIAMENASGEDLNWFFSQWFEKPGHPVLSIKQNYIPETGKLTVTVSQKQDPDISPLYKLPVIIDISTRQGIIHKKVWVEHKQDSFWFSLQSAPLLVNFDAEKLLLCQKIETKPAAQWYYQYFHGQNYADRYESFESISQDHRDLAADSVHWFYQASLHDASWNIRRLAINSLYSLASDSYVKDSLYARVEYMAVHDNNSKVRVAALNYLQQKEGTAAKNIFMKALQDSSYDVLATAIRHIHGITSRKDSAWLLKMLPAFQFSRSGGVQLAIGDVYSAYPALSHLDFFHRAPHYLFSYQFSMFIEEYKTLLLALDIKQVQAEKAFILNLDNSFTELGSMLAYKNMLNDLVKRLKEYPGKNFPEKEMLIQAFTEKSVNTRLNAN